MFNFILSVKQLTFGSSMKIPTLGAKRIKLNVDAKLA